MFSKAYKSYVLSALTLVYALNYLDRNLIALLLQPIKEDLRLTDTQLGFLTGIAFALFYATLGLPIARWADRGNRVTITSIAIGLWSVTMMACLLVTNFLQLVWTRVAAAVGEAGCLPPTYSLVGDYFPEAAERTRAMTVYMLAGSIAAVISFILGGWLNEHYGWRITFFLMGIPGLLTAVVVRMTLAEPRLRTMESRTEAQRLPRMKEVLATLWRQRSARHLILALISLFTMGSGLAPWYAAFMMRSHGMGTAELGIWFGLIFGIGGIVGISLGGYVAARWFSGDERGQMRLIALMNVLLVPGLILFLLLPHKQQALLALLPLVIVSTVFAGPTFALLQRLVPNEMRATTMAVAMLLINLIGMGAGPQIVGISSDLLLPTLGSDSLRYAMFIMSFVALLAAYQFWQVGRTVSEDLHH
jgi:MFS family permease